LIFRFPVHRFRAKRTLSRIDEDAALERQSFQIETIDALMFWWSMIFSENRFPLFRIML